MPVEELEAKHLAGLAPLLLLTKGGATFEVLERAIAQLEAVNKPEGLAMLKWVAGVVFKSADDLKRVQRRFAVLDRFLWENSWTYREAMKERKEIGREEGREEGIRQSIEVVVNTRFPDLIDLARERIEHIQSQEKLQTVLVAMIAAPTEREAKRYLLALKESE